MENKSSGKLWKVKKRLYRGGSQGQNQKDHTAQAEVTIYSPNYLFAATLKFKQPKFLNFVIFIEIILHVKRLIVTKYE
jgi:7,8-dihydro-6-hydroxymethylpterin-pyrophosphokinase